MIKNVEWLVKHGKFESVVKLNDIWHFCETMDPIPLNAEGYLLKDPCYWSFWEYAEGVLNNHINVESVLYNVFHVVSEVEFDEIEHEWYCAINILFNGGFHSVDVCQFDIDDGGCHPMEDSGEVYDLLVFCSKGKGGE